MAATIGANLKPCSNLAGWGKLRKCLGFRRFGKSRQLIPIHTKAGVPASNTAADDPGSVSFIIDTTNSDVYFCHTWVSSSSFTVVKVSN
jgi:hypothetical protein